MKKTIVLVVLALMFCGVSAVRANEVVEKLALYIPNRLIDALDTFTCDVGLGPSVRIELMATQVCKFGGGIGISPKLIKDYNRQYGIGINNGWYWSFLCIGQENMERAKCTRYVKNYQQNFEGCPAPDLRIYDLYTGERDFWQIGGALGLGVEAEVYIHPVEIADFVAGVFFIDLKGDDITFEDFQN